MVSLSIDQSVLLAREVHIAASSAKTPDEALVGDIGDARENR